MKTKFNLHPRFVFFAGAILSALIAVFTQPAFGQFAGPFVHPGGMHTQADFDRMKSKVAANQSPWVDSYNKLTPLWLANLNMPWAPVTQIIRGVPGSNYARSQKDALAIYYLALRWRITGDTNYAEEAIEGCDRWSSTMTNGVGGNSNWALGAGLCGYEFAVAGEALRGYPGWSQTSISNYSRFLKIFGDGNDAFLNAHNGTCNSHYWCNWDACNLASLMAVAVFTDDTNRFNRAVTYLKQGKGNGNLTAAVWFTHPDGLGQCQESGRDQPHAVDGLAWLGVALQIAWNQGVDLYSFDNNLFLRGLEYYAKFNLWNDVPYQTFGVCNTTFGWGTTALAYGGRGFLPPTWDLFYNHYVNVKGLAAPWTARAAAALRPDGFYDNSNSPDFLGFTTLTHLLDPIPAGAVPSGLEAKVYGTNVLLSWWGSAYATNYLIKRATVSGGPYATIASLPAATENVYFDSTITNGGTYYYVVSAQDKFGDSPNSPETRIGINELRTYYRFNEASGGSVVDASGLSPSATLMNGATFTSGRFGNGVNLNGASQYVALPDGLLNGLRDVTFSVWVYLNNQSTWARIFDFGADTDKYMFLSPRNSGGGIRFAITKFTGNGEQGINGPAVSIGAWHHIAVTLKAGSDGSGAGTLYLDGAPVATNSAMTFHPDMIGRLVNATNNYIGRSQWPGDPYLNGRVDDFRIYNGALSAGEIAALHALNPVAPSAPAGASAMPVSANAVHLAWNPSPDADSYLVQRSFNSGGPYSVIASGVTETNYTDSAVSGSTTYYYVVAAGNEGGTSANSPEASATTLTPPPVPTSLVATGLFGGQIVLSWNSSAGASGYNVKRSMLPGGPYVTVAASVSGNTFTNSGLILSATYYYVVSAVSGAGESADSYEASSIVPVPTLVWKGSVNSDWDIDATTNWLFGAAPSTYFSDGAAVRFDNTAATGSVNLMDNVSPYSITFSNSSLPYTVNSANGSGISGPASITKLGTGTVTLTTTNTFTGDISINGGGTLAVGGAGLLGGGDYAGNIANYSTFNYGSTATQTISGIISQSGRVLKTGSGTLTLAGANSYTGDTIHRQGWLNISGAPKSGAGGIYVVNNEAASTTSATLNISSDLTAYRLWLGDRAGLGQVGAAYQTSGNVVFTQGGSVDDFRIGSVAGGMGYYRLSGGTLRANEVGVGSTQNNTLGIFEITGGSFTDTGWLNIGQGGGTSSGLLNITGGSVSSWRADLNWAGTSGAMSVINVGGGSEPAALSLGTDTALGINLASGNTAGTFGILNLRSNGTVTTSSIRAAQSNPTTVVNFNGGMLRANTTSGRFLTDGNIDSILVYAGGGTIDNGGKTIVVDRPLQAPAGLGVTAITGPSNGGSGYVAPPMVTVNGGTGIRATAYAVMTDDGTGRGTFKVGSIVVSSPGAYSAAPASITLQGGGPTAPASGFSIQIAANVSGGMTFSGGGTTALGGSNTYAGPTIIASGTVKQGGPLLHLSFDQTSGTTVVNGGSAGSAFNGTLTGTNVSITAAGRVGKGLLVGTGPVNNGCVQINSAVVPFNVSGTWSWAMWIKTTAAGAAYMYQGDGGWASGNTSFYLNPGSAANGTKGGGVRWGQGWQTGTAVLNDGNWHFIVMTCNAGAKTFYVDGVVDPWTKNEWGGLGTGNQLRIGGSANTGDGNAPFNGLIDEVYIFSRALNASEVSDLMNSVIPAANPALPHGTDLAMGPGAALVLHGPAQTVGSLEGEHAGTIKLGAGSLPTAFTFGDDANSTFGGSITGNGSVAKTGSGEITLSGISTYSGATLITNGTVKFDVSDNTNYVATLAPLLWFDFNQVGEGIVTNIGLGGEALNGEIIGDGATAVSGRYGNGLGLDGTTYISIPNRITPLDCTSDGASWTYALWIKTSTGGATFGYQGDGTWGSGFTTFYLNNNNSSAGGTRVGGVRWGDGYLTGATAVNNNNWHFIAITVSAGVKTIYVDGNLDAKIGTTGWNAAASGAANQFWIGYTPSTTDGCAPFNGSVDEVYMFDRALTQAEVRNIMSNKTAVAHNTFAGALPAASPVSLAAAAVLDLNGISQAFASLSDLEGAGGTVTNSGSLPATLTLNTTLGATFNGSIGDTSTANAISLVKSGVGTQTLNGPTRYHGNTTVNGGVLALGHATLPVEGVVNVTNDAVLSLNFAGTNRIGGLVLGGVLQANGVYSAANSAPFLAGTGALQVGDVVSLTATNVVFTVSGNTLTLSWPASHIGWRLETQTNSLATGLGTNWFTMIGSSATNQLALPISVTNGTVFFRLVYP